MNPSTSINKFVRPKRPQHSIVVIEHLEPLEHLEPIEPHKPSKLVECQIKPLRGMDVICGISGIYEIRRTHGIGVIGGIGGIGVIGALIKLDLKSQRSNSGRAIHSRAAASLSGLRSSKRRDEGRANHWHHDQNLAIYNKLLAAKSHVIKLIARTPQVIFERVKEITMEIHKKDKRIRLWMKPDPPTDRTVRYDKRCQIKEMDAQCKARCGPSEQEEITGAQLYPHKPNTKTFRRIV